MFLRAPAKLVFASLDTGCSRLGVDKHGAHTNTLRSSVYKYD